MFDFLQATSYWSCNLCTMEFSTKVKSIKISIFETYFKKINKSI